MERYRDEEIINELMQRLKARDKACHDLTAMTKNLATLNERLLESEKVKGHFLSNIRNEINNPLTSVLPMCELILSSDGPDAFDAETCRSLVATIRKEAFSLNFQLRNIFVAAELEAGEEVLSVSAVDVATLLKSTAGAFAHRAAEKKITIATNISDDVRHHCFRTDPEKLQCVLSNLIANAIEFSYEERPVSIRAWKDNGELSVSVTDYGIGMDERDQGAIFERFRQLEAGATKQHGGHGLGLSIIKSTIELLGGAISVVSKKGAGAVFTVTVPEMAGEESSVFAVDGNEFFFGTEGERF